MEQVHRKLKQLQKPDVHQRLQKQDREHKEIRPVEIPMFGQVYRSEKQAHQGLLDRDRKLHQGPPQSQG